MTKSGGGFLREIYGITRDVQVLLRLDTSGMAHIYSFEISKCFKARRRSENLKQTN